MEISKSDRDAMIDLLYDMYDADLVDVALETLGENELFDGIPAMLEDYYFDENEDWQVNYIIQYDLTQLSRQSSRLKNCVSVVQFDLSGRARL